LTGHLTEADARALAQLESVEDFELAGILAGQDDTALEREDVDHLLDLVGEYGVLHGRTLAIGGAIGLAQWLADKSGLKVVHDQITRRFLRRSEALKARYVIGQLQRLAAGSPYRAEVCAILESVQLQPALHPLRELSALELMLRWDPTHPLVEELDHLGVSATRAEALRLPAEAEPATIVNAAQQACLRCRRERLTAFSAAEREAWTVLERSYQLLFSQHL
jgi:hypothetical protein